MVGHWYETKQPLVVDTQYRSVYKENDSTQCSPQVGLMRNGVILDEDTPSRLLARYGCDTMEDVFLRLSIKQQRQQNLEVRPHNALCYSRQIKQMKAFLKFFYEGTAEGTAFSSSVRAFNAQVKETLNERKHSDGYE